MNGVIAITTQKEWDYLFDKQPKNSRRFHKDNWINQYKENTLLEIRDGDFYSYGDNLSDWNREYEKFYTFK